MKLYQSNEVAAELGVTLRHLYRLLDAGVIPEPAKRIGPVRVFTEQELRAAKKALANRMRNTTKSRLIRRWKRQQAVKDATMSASTWGLVAQGPQIMDAPAPDIRGDASESLLTSAQLAEKLNVRESWVRDQTRTRARIRAKTRPLPCVRVGKYVRFRWSDVCEWLDREAAKVA